MNNFLKVYVVMVKTTSRETGNLLNVYPVKAFDNEKNAKGYADYKNGIEKDMPECDKVHKYYHTSGMNVCSHPEHEA